MNPLELSKPSMDELSEKSRDSLMRYSAWFSAVTGEELVVEMRNLLMNLACAAGRGGWVNGNPAGWRYDYSYEEFDKDVSLLLREINSVVLSAGSPP